MERKLNGFNNGRDTTDGIGGKSAFENKINHMKKVKYEFKEIKDIDISKLENDVYFIKDIHDCNFTLGKYWLEKNKDIIKEILLPCSPIVEKDKLREEFNDFCGNNLDDYLSKKDKNNIFDFFLHHLLGSKKVEISEKINWNDYVESMTNEKTSS